MMTARDLTPAKRKEMRGLVEWFRNQARVGRAAGRDKWASDNDANADELQGYLDYYGEAMAALDN